MKVKKHVLIFLASVLFLVITTFVLHDKFKDKNIEEMGLLPDITSIGKGSNLVPTNSPESIENSKYKIYRKDEIKFQDLRYVSKETYEKIAEICGKIDYMGNIIPINFEENPFYREQYLKVLKGEKSYINRLEERGYSELVDLTLKIRKNIHIAFLT